MRESFSHIVCYFSKWLVRFPKSLVQNTLKYLPLSHLWEAIEMLSYGALSSIYLILHAKVKLGVMVLS